MNGIALWKKTAYVTALFIVGAATGAVISVSVTKEMMTRPPRSRDMSEQMMKALRSRLDLTPEQLQKVDPIIEKTSADMQAIYVESRKKGAAVMDASYKQIAAVLTPEQKEKLDKMQSERHHFGGPPPGPPPGGPHEPRHHHHSMGENGPGDNGNGKPFPMPQATPPGGQAPQSPNQAPQPAAPNTSPPDQPSIHPLNTELKSSPPDANSLSSLPWDRPVPLPPENRPPLEKPTVPERFPPQAPEK